MTTLSTLTTQVRDLTGIAAQDIISDALIQRFLNEAYLELCASTEWPFLERIDYLELPAGGHLVSTDTGVQAVQEVVLAVGDREILAVPVYSSLRMRSHGSWSRTTEDVFYDVQEDAIEVYPSLDVNAVVRIRYQESPENLSLNQEPAFRKDFHTMLAYRAAVKVLVVMVDETPRVQTYTQEYNDYLDRMVSFYKLSHDESAFRVAAREGGIR